MANPEINMPIENQETVTLEVEVDPGETVQAPVDETLQISGMAADAKAAGDAIRENAAGIEALEEAAAGKVPKPETNPDGTDGQLLRTNGDGTTTWTDQGTPTDAQVGTAVAAWLTAHPEATTTVQDGAITEQKLAAGLQAKVTQFDGLGLSVVSGKICITYEEE